MIRLAEKKDIGGILECLKELSDVEYTDFHNIETAFDIRNKQGVLTLVYVKQDGINEEVMGTASLVVTDKLSHNGKSCILLDDVAVRKDCQRQKIGSELIKTGIKLIKKTGAAYKIILNCSEDLIPYYRKLGFYEAGYEMRLDIE